MTEERARELLNAGLSPTAAATLSEDELGGAGVSSVNGQTGPVVVLVASDVGADPAGAADALAAISIQSLGPSNGVDDTDMIQAALDAVRSTFLAGKVTGLPGETYLITTILVGSLTTLDMTGCTVRQIDDTNTNMVRNYAHGTARTIQDAAITAGDTTLTSATADFQSGDAGHNIRIWGASNGEIFINTIASVTSSTEVELFTAPETTVVNGQATIRQWDTDIHIRGGIWHRGDNGRLHEFEPGHDGDEDFRIQDSSGFGILIRRAQRVTCRDLTFTGGNADTCTALCFGDCDEFVADNIASDLYVSGLIQITGPARHGHFSNIYGRCTDDLCAILPVDWLTGVRDMWGDVSYITMEDIHSEWCDGSLVLICPGSASLGISTEHIYIRNVYGRDTNLTQHQGGLVWLADSTSYADMAGGRLEDVVIENVSGEPMGDYDKSRGLVYVESANVGRLRLSGLNIHTPTGSVRHGVILGAGTNIEYLSIADAVISSVDGGCELINFLDPAAVIENLDVFRCALRENGVWTMLSMRSNTTYAETMLAIPDLLLYWRLGEPSGTTAGDAMASYDGTYVGTPTLGAAGLLAGDLDTAWTGNGTDTEITGPTIPALPEWSIIVWAKSNGLNTDYAGYFSTPGDQIDIVRNTDGQQPGQFRIYDGGSWQGGSQATIDTTPTMIVVTYSVADGMTSYKNGAVLTNYPSGGRALNNAAFTVGNLGGARTIDTLDEFAIVGRAMTALEIAALYSKGS